MTKQISIINPDIERIHPIGKGVQKLWFFDNGYGASVVRFKIGQLGIGSYTTGDNWELAVIKVKDKDKLEFDLCYDTPITNDVMGHLSDNKVEKILKEIQKLEPYKK